jgi:hypothetical protein
VHGCTLPLRLRFWPLPIERCSERRAQLGLQQQPSWLASTGAANKSLESRSSERERCAKCCTHRDTACITIGTSKHPHFKVYREYEWFNAAYSSLRRINCNWNSASAAVGDLSAQVQRRNPPYRCPISWCWLRSRSCRCCCHSHWTRSWRSWSCGKRCCWSKLGSPCRRSPPLIR